MSVVLYLEKKYGKGKPLQDFSSHALTEPPEWVKEGIIYELFIRSFSKEGTFREVENKLDYLEEIGVTVIWLMPIYPIGEVGKKGSAGSPYSIFDHRDINSSLGTPVDFKHLVELIHKRGMKVILDLVANHASNDNVLIEKYPNWFLRNSTGDFMSKNEDWTDVTDFNYNNYDLVRYMNETCKYWIKEYDIDGFRCDVAGMVPYSFWEDTLKQLREIKPDIFFLAEWEDPSILKKGFNSDYDWTLYFLLKDINKGLKSSQDAINFIHERDNLYPQNSLPLRFLENHDYPRALLTFGKRAIKAYATFLFTIPGVPLIYAGQEMGDTGDDYVIRHDHYSLTWEDFDKDLYKFYQSLISLRKKYSCFTHGNFIPLTLKSSGGTAGAFLRQDDETTAFIVCNLQENTLKDVIFPEDQNISNSLRYSIFENIHDKSFRIQLDSLFIKEIPAHTTEVFILKK